MSVHLSSVATIFLNQACAWFLKIDIVQTSVCVCVSVCVRPLAIKNHSCKMKPE